MNQSHEPPVDPNAKPPAPRTDREEALRTLLPAGLVLFIIPFAVIGLAVWWFWSEGTPQGWIQEQVEVAELGPEREEFLFHDDSQLWIGNATNASPLPVLPVGGEFVISWPRSRHLDWVSQIAHFGTDNKVTTWRRNAAPTEFIFPGRIRGYWQSPSGDSAVVHIDDGDRQFVEVLSLDPRRHGSKLTLAADESARPQLGQPLSPLRIRWHAGGAMLWKSDVIYTATLDTLALVAVSAADPGFAELHAQLQAEPHDGGTGTAAAQPGRLDARQPTPRRSGSLDGSPRRAKDPEHVAKWTTSGSGDLIGPDGKIVIDYHGPYRPTPVGLRRDVHFGVHRSLPLEQTDRILFECEKTIYLGDRRTGRAALLYRGSLEVPND